MRIKPINRGYFPIGNLNSLWIARRGILLMNQPYSKAFQVPHDTGPNAYSLSFRALPIEGTLFSRLIGCLITRTQPFQEGPYKPFKFIRITGEPDED
jgi:hypothetical protein